MGNLTLTPNIPEPGEDRTISYLVNSYTNLHLEPGNGTSYTQVYISTNGFLQFAGQDSPTATTNAVSSLEALARKDNRSLAGYAEIVLREHVEGKKSGKSAGKRKS